MRTTLVLVISVAATGACRPDFTTLDEACGDTVPGQARFEDGAEPVQAVGRINCYRRLAQMSQARVDPKISSAARAHARYLAMNGYGGLTADGAEDPSLEGFTGEYPWDRMDAQGYDTTFEGFEDGYHFWTVGLPTVDDVDLEIDLWMDHYLTRQALLQPAVEGVGWGRSGDFTVLENYSPFPTDERVERPILFPRDGQVGVPVGFVNGFATEPMGEGALVGYPITITVGSAAEGSDVFAANPYGLVLLDQLVLDPENNQVEVYELQPETTPAPMPYTIALVPEEPLEPGTTYRVFARVSWIDGIREVRGEFTTSADAMDPASAARRAAIAAEARIVRAWAPRGAALP